MQVSAYIPCFNSAQTLPEAVAAIYSGTVSPVELLIVDDHSNEPIPDLAGTRLIRMPARAGRGKVRNRAMAEARCELVLAVDATLRLHPQFLERALPWFADSRVAAVFGWVEEAAPPTLANRWRGRHLFRNGAKREIRHQGLLATGCCVIRKPSASAVGGFIEAEGEDASLGRRLLAAGYDVIFDPALYATCVTPNHLGEVLRRYARWNSPDQLTWSNYARQVRYAVKVMVGQDLQSGDWAAALVSLLCPHYQYWRKLRQHWRKGRAKS